MSGYQQGPTLQVENDMLLKSTKVPPPPRRRHQRSRRKPKTKQDPTPIGSIMRSSEAPSRPIAAPNSDSGPPKTLRVVRVPASSTMLKKVARPIIDAQVSENALKKPCQTLNSMPDLHADWFSMRLRELTRQQGVCCRCLGWMSIRSKLRRLCGKF